MSPIEWVCCSCGYPKIPSVVDAYLHGDTCDFCGHDMCGICDEATRQYNEATRQYNESFHSVGIRIGTAPHELAPEPPVRSGDHERPRSESNTLNTAIVLSGSHKEEIFPSDSSKAPEKTGVESLSQCFLQEDISDNSGGGKKLERDNNKSDETQEERIKDTKNGSLKTVAVPPERTDENIDAAQTRLSTVSALDSLAESPFLSFSGSSRSSIRGPQGAGERLASVLFGDPVMHSLCYQAAQTTTLERFELNLRRLLQTFSNDLYEEAQSTKDRSVAHFVRTQARKSAALICNELDPKSESSGLGKKEAGDTSESNLEDDEILDLRYLESVFSNSVASDKLRANLRHFIGPEETSSANDGKLTAQDLFIFLPFAESVPGSEFQTGLNTRQGWGAIPKYAIKTVNRFLRHPPLPKRMKRVTWTCSCGRDFYDDYEELETGAAKRFQRTLRQNFPRQRTRRYHGYHYNIKKMCQYCVTVAKTMVTSLKSLYQKFSVKVMELPTVELQSTQPLPLPAIPEQHQPTEQLFMLLCMGDSTSRFTTRAHQPAVHDVNSDQKLFRMFRSCYCSLRTRWWSWITLWELKHIHFVHFEMYEKSLVDIKELNALPPEEFNTLYSYERSNLKPPIGSNLLVHYFRCPDDAPSATPCFRKIPKKMNQKLTVCPTKGVSSGWGLHFVEGWSWKNILTLSCFMFIVTSFGVGVLYWKFQHSIQDASAIATFVLTCFAISISTLQAWSCLS